MRRLAQGLLVVFAASTIAFFLMHAAPGDPFTHVGDGASASPEMVAIQRARFALDRPLPEQYLRWLTNAARGEFGWSITYQQPIASVIATRLPNTLQLMGLALVSSIGFGVFIGGWQGAHANTRRDRAITTLTLFLYSLPEFWLSLMLMLLFAYKLGVLPVSGMTSEMHDYMGPMAQLRDRLWHLVLPWFVLTLVGTALFARFQRAAMFNTMGEQFVRTARAKGLREGAVYRHALRASLLPVITMAGLLFPALVGGAVFVENVFAWPGMGRLMVDAVGERDYWVVAAAIVIGSAMTALGTLLADFARAIADPRIGRSTL